jgi:predicted lipoprotein with Yx(FWY)xxD motif
MRKSKLLGAVLLVGLVVAGGGVLAAQDGGRRGGGGGRRGGGAGGGAAAMPAGVHTMAVSTGAQALVTQGMMTLYTFAKDAPGVSNCNDMCAKNWPPLAAAADAQPTGDWTIVTRMDGSKQWAYKGMPLYTWIKDQKPMDATGDGVGNGAWKIAVP